jgi:hypothetical protein
MGTIYAWLGRGIGVLLLAGTVMLTLAAGAWRRVPLAAAGLIALEVTSYWVPVLGRQIADALGSDLSSRHLYGLVRYAVNVSATVFVVASLAAGGRDPAPDARTAAGGLRLARGALIFRIVAAIAIALLVVAGRSSEDAVKVIAMAGPSVVVIAMAGLAIGLQRVASARLDGMPRLLLSIGAALTLIWAAIQFEQATVLLDAIVDRFGGSHALEVVQYFSLAGPLAATLGLALVGTSIASFAGHRGEHALRASATSRTTTFVLLTLGSIAIPLLARPTSPGGAIAVLLFAAITTILGLLALAALLAQAAESVESEPGIPPARIV